MRYWVRPPGLRPNPYPLQCGRYAAGRRLRPAKLCVDFDATRSADPGAGPLEYRWDMGDGTTLTGLTITHCYAKREHYQVVLDGVVPATGEVRPAEKTFDVDLTRKLVLNFSVGPTLTVRVGRAVAFDALNSVLPECQSVVVVWDFRDGFTQQGRRVEHSFRKAGRFPVRMSLRGYGPGACAASHCVSQEVIVEPWRRLANSLLLRLANGQNIQHQLPQVFVRNNLYL